MDQDRQHTEQFTDEELVLLRRARFGELPAGVVPDDLIETTETDRPHEEPQEPSVRREWGGGNRESAPKVVVRRNSHSPDICSAVM